MSGYTPPKPFPAADTRLPFKGNLAFDRKSQAFVPFKTTSDAMLASLMLAYRLASPILTVVLAIVRHPNFNPAEISLSRAEDVWARVSEHEAEAALERRNNKALPFSLPDSVMDGVIDVLEEDRRAALYAQRDQVEPHLKRIITSEIEADLRSMSLVCKDWRRPVQRALGKILVLQDVRKGHVAKANAGPLFGHWTREIIVLRHFLRMEEVKRLLLNEEAHETYLLFGNLLSRLRNVRSISVSTDWFEWPMRHVQRGLHGILDLREVRLVQLGEIPQLFTMACDVVRDSPTLEHLYLQYSGSGWSNTVYAMATPPPPLHVQPRPSYKKLTLKIGGTSEFSLQYINWLTHPREGENAFRLKSLDLDLTTCYRNDVKCFETLEPCLRMLDELCINVNGLSESLVSRIFASCTVLRRLSVITRHTFERKVYDRLPATLEEVNIDFSFEAPDWEEWDRRTAWFIRTRLNPLRRLRIRMLCADRLVDPGENFSTTKALCNELGIDGVFTFDTVGSRHNL